MIDRAERVPVRAKVLVQGGSWQSVSRSRNISQTGVFIEQTGAVKVDDTLTLIIYDEAHSRLVNAQARVVRVVAEGFGARFLHATAAGRTEVQHFIANF